jgi:hypothetical protein
MKFQNCLVLAIITQAFSIYALANGKGVFYDQILNINVNLFEDDNDLV